MHFIYVQQTPKMNDIKMYKYITFTGIMAVINFSFQNHLKLFRTGVYFCLNITSLVTRVNCLISKLSIENSSDMPSYEKDNEA